MREGESKEDVLEQAPSGWSSLDTMHYNLYSRQITKLIQIGQKAVFILAGDIFLKDLKVTYK